MPDVYCIANGRLLPLNEPAIHATDRSFALGDGIFETIKVHSSKPVWFSEHLKRLNMSGIFAGIQIPEEKDVKKFCSLLIEKNGIKGGFLRITLSRGTSATGRLADFPKEGNLIITGGNLPENEKVCRAGFAPWPLNENDPAVRHKTVSRFSSVMAWKEAKKRRLDELVFLNTKGLVSEGIVSNIFFVKNGTLFTPSIECGLLPGITRAKVIECAEKSGIKTVEGEFSKSDILNADELFFTNSLALIRVCFHLEGKIYKESKTGESLKQQLEALI